MKHDISMGIAAFCGAALFTLTLGVVLTDCKKAEVPTVGELEAGAPIAAAGCVSLEAFDSSGVLQAICADLPLIEEVAAAVIPLFAVKKGEACTVLPANGQCYTNTQRLAMINKLRAKDAGR